MQRVNPGGCLALLAFALLHAQVGRATIVTVPDSDFELPGNMGSLPGIVGNTTQQLGTGPWSATSKGVAGLLGPTLSIDPGLTGGTDGSATLSGLASLNIVQLLTNGGEFFQSLAGVPLQPNTTYRFSADVTTSSTVTLSLLANSGVGIGIGTTSQNDLVKSTTAPAGAVTLVSAGLTGRLTLEYTAPASVPSGDIRLRLFGGDYDSIASISVLPSVTFDNVSLEIVPEPRTLGLLAVGCVGLVRRRRS